jgi:predicted MFS family arabinose efflux permease
MLFLINLPVALVLVFFSWKLLPSVKIGEGKKIDILGLITLTLTLASFAFGLSQIDQKNFIISIFSINVIPFILFSIIFLILFIIREKRIANPVVKLSLFKSKQIKIVTIIAICAGLTQSLVIFIPKYTISLFSVTNSTASLMLLPLVISSAVASPIIGRMLDKYGSRIIVISGMILVSIGMSLLLFTTTLQLQFYISSIPFGFGITMLMSSPLRYIMLNEVPPSDRALTQGLLTIFISVGQIVGTAIIPSLIVIDINGVLGYHIAMMILILINTSLVFLALKLKNRKLEMETLKIGTAYYTFKNKSFDK